MLIGIGNSLKKQQVIKWSIINRLICNNKLCIDRDCILSYIYISKYDFRRTITRTQCDLHTFEEYL